MQQATGRPSYYSRFKKVLVSASLITLAIASGLDKGLILPTKVQTLIIPPVQASGTLAPFGTETLVSRTVPYVSRLEDVDSYYAVQATWQQSDAAALSLWVRNSENQDWTALGIDPDADATSSLPALLSRSSQFQMKVLVKEGSVSNIQVQTLDPGQINEASIPQASADQTVITRAQWGADESLRLRETRDHIRAEAAKKASPKPAESKPATPSPSAAPTTDNKTSDSAEYGPNCSILEAKYPDEFKVGQVITTDTAGKEFTWPIAYTLKLRKIVVHHTDMEIKDYDQNGVIDSADYMAAVRSIYYFHAISRDWGDIGYNYLIDPDGHIYEGRAGGDMAIAAHTLCKNNGSLGVALLGNFKDQTPTPAALQALQSLVDIKTKAYNIDPQGMGMFYGSLIPNIVGHRNVRSTDCPGDRLYDLLPQLRAGSLATKENITFPVIDPSIYRKSYPVPTTPSIPETQKVYRSQAQSVIASVLPEPGKTVHPTLTFQNLGTTVWNQETVIRPVYLPKGATLLRQAKQQQELVSPNGFATFAPELVFDGQLSGRSFTIEFYVVVNDQVELNTETVKVQVQVVDQAKSDITLNGVPLDQIKTTLSQNAIAAQLRLSTTHLTKFFSEEIGGPSTNETDTTHKNIRVRLQAPDNAAVAEASSDANLVIDNRTVATIIQGNTIVIVPQSQGLLVKAGKNSYIGAVVRLIAQGEEPKVTLTNVSHVPDWNPNLNDNIYRGVIEWRILSGKLLTINELPLEMYLRGLAEVSNTAHPEKQKVMAIIARSYAQYYLTKDKKFPGMPYDLDDDPNSSQKYLGYGYEMRSPNFVQAVVDTVNQVVTYQGEVVKTPYFNKSDGRTRSAKEVWGWTNTPYLVSLPDTLCKNDDHKLSGHGVGLSGCGADGAAARGYTAEQILHYYYPGTIISTL